MQSWGWGVRVSTEAAGGPACERVGTCWVPRLPSVTEIIDFTGNRVYRQSADRPAELTSASLSKNYLFLIDWLINRTRGTAGRVGEFWRA